MKRVQDPVELLQHDPQWIVEFEELASVLRAGLPELASIEHIGSTAVPGLVAKPILDMDIVVSAPDDFPGVSRALAQLGYDHRGDLGIAGREAFGRMGPDVPYTEEGRLWMKHHLYVCVEGSTPLRRHRQFRDLLQGDARVAKEYAELKTRLAERYRTDRERYTSAKSNFIEAVLESR